MIAIVCVNLFVLGFLAGYTLAPYSPANKRLKAVRADYRAYQDDKRMAEVIEIDDTSSVDSFINSFNDNEPKEDV